MSPFAPHDVQFCKASNVQETAVKFVRGMKAGDGAETATAAQVIRRSFSIHMKRTSVLAFTLALVCVSGIYAQAATAPPATAAAPAPGAVKVAVIEFQYAVSQTNEFQRDFADLQKKYEPKRTELKNLDAEVQNLTKQLQAQSSTLTDSERQARVDALNDKKRQEQNLLQDDQSDYGSDIQQLMNSLAQKVGAVLTAYAHQHGYTMVLDATPDQQQQAPVVLYANPAVDITKAIIDAYNAKSGIPAPPPPAPAPAAPKPAAH